MGLWSWLREVVPWSGSSRPEPPVPRVPADRDTAAPPPIPGGARCRPSSGHSATARSPSRGSVTSPGASRPGRAPGCSPGWSTDADRRRPRGRWRGSSTRSAGRPVSTSLPAAVGDVVPLVDGPSGRAASGDVVQRSVRFDRPGGAVQRALSDLRGTSEVVQRAVEPSTGSDGSSSSGVSGVSGSATVGVSPAEPPPASDVGDGPAARAETGPYGAGSSGSEPSGSEPSGSDAEPSSEPSGSEPSGSEPSGSEPFVARSFAEPADSGPSAAIRPSDFAPSQQAGETGSTPPVAQRSVADADADGPIASAPTLGATPLQRTLADPPAPVGPTGRALPQLPVVPEQVVARSFVTAPLPPTARPALPVVAGSSAGEYLQRSAVTSPAPSVSSSATPTTAALDAGHTAPGLVGGAPDAAGPSPDGPVAGATSASPGVGASGLTPTASAPPDPPGRAPLLADASPTPQLTSGASIDPIDAPSTPTISRLAAGPTPAPRRLGLGAPLTRPPHRPPGSPGEAGPVVQMLPAGPAGSVDVPGPVGAAPSPGVEPAGSDIRPPDVPGSSAEHGAAAHVDAGAPTPDLPPAVPEPVTPEPVTRESTTDADSAGTWWPAAPEHATPLLGDRPITTALSPSVTPAVQRSAADDIVPIRWGDPGSPGPAGITAGWPCCSRTGSRATLLQSSGAPAPRTPAPPLPRRRAHVLRPLPPRARAGTRARRPSRRASRSAQPTGRWCSIRPRTHAGPVSLQRFGLPSLPKMPSPDAVAAVHAEHAVACRSMPSLPSLPSLPSVPSLPSGLPSLPSGMPALPSGLPSLPSLPAGLPSLPSLPSGLPSVPGLPSLPSGLPSLGNLPSGLPAMPSLPDLPSIPSADQISDRAESTFDAAKGAVGRAADAASGAVGDAVDAAKGAAVMPSTARRAWWATPSTPPRAPSARPPAPPRVPPVRSPPPPPTSSSAASSIRSPPGSRPSSGSTASGPASSPTCADREQPWPTSTLR